MAERMFVLYLIMAGMLVLGTADAIAGSNGFDRIKRKSF